jgi:hypothetical protein
MLSLVSGWILATSSGSPQADRLVFLFEDPRALRHE